MIIVTANIGLLSFRSDQRFQRLVASTIFTRSNLVSVHAVASRWAS